MVEIDGAYGEGGGQILRSALTLSLLTGESIHIEGIRAGRTKPGLLAQHLQSVKAAATISEAATEGVRIGSTSLLFHPGRVHAGDYRFDIGTAGAASLVLQTIFMPLALVEQPSRVTVTGGTHVPCSPCFHYLDRQWLPWLEKMGIAARLRMSRAGFFPRGGGRIDAAIAPSPLPAPLQSEDRGALKRFRILSLVSRLPKQIAERQLQAASDLLSIGDVEKVFEIRELPSDSPGTMLLVRAEFVHGTATHFALGARGKPAEQVGAEAAKETNSFLESGAAVDEHGADQLVLPLAFATGDSRVHTARITSHLLTNIAIIRQFLRVEIEVEGDRGEPGRVHIRKPAGKLLSRGGR